MMIEPIDLIRTGVRRGLRHFGLELRRTIGLIEFLASRNVDLVIDVGANTGQFAEQLRQLGYRGHIASFEPLRDAFAELAAKSRNDTRWTCYNLALGDETGDATINVSRNTVFSSLLPQTQAAGDYDESSTLDHVETIELRRLDDLASELPGDNVFLKIDTQGFEKHVLDGGRACLARAIGLQLELPLVHLYQNTWTLSDALNYMAEAGFVLSQTTPVNYRREDPISLLEMDGVFRRLDAGDSRPA